jgi:predicted transcriptional regulator
MYECFEKKSSRVEWRICVALCNPACYTFSEEEVIMTTLHVRSFPDDLYQRLQRLAEARNRSLSAQVVTLLADALDAEDRQSKQAQVLMSIHRRRFSPPAQSSSSLDLLHEDRQR